MGETKRILVTGATGKVGRTFIDQFLADPAFDAFTVRALCHNRVLEPRPRLEIVKGSLENREDGNEAVRNTTHVLHLATSKETPGSELARTQMLPVPLCIPPTGVVCAATSTGKHKAPDANRTVKASFRLFISAV
jgi:uncharacterized protein YbjT (DUF2867 family)